VGHDQRGELRAQERDHAQRGLRYRKDDDAIELRADRGPGQLDPAHRIERVQQIRAARGDMGGEQPRCHHAIWSASGSQPTWLRNRSCSPSRTTIQTS
jgi:hypothetical protein